MHRQTGRRFLWTRSLTATVAGQFADSVVFFILAFGGMLPATALVEVILVGFLVKVSVGVLSLPALYAAGARAYTDETKEEVRYV
jgi:hypothetical protein